MNKTFCVLVVALLIGMVLSCVEPPPASKQNSNGSHTGDTPFQHVIIDDQPNSGSDCCTDVCALGDINGDGYLDVVIGGENAERDGLVWYEYPQWTKHPVASGQFTTDGQTCDVDADGDIDIVISNNLSTGNGIYWYENLGDATDAWTAHKVGPGYGHDVEGADIDGDGDVDIVTCDKAKLTLWQQISPTCWLEHVLLIKSGEGTAIADIDRDGDPDIVYGRIWLENEGDFGSAPATQHVIDESWPDDTRAKVADINDDGRPDVVLTVSEGTGPIAWFEAPEDPGEGVWIKHLIDSENLEGAHSLQIADMDSDGDPDIVTAEMHKSTQKRVLIYLQTVEANWQRQVVATTGSHNLRTGDIGRDGDIDIIGKNYAGPNRVIEMWENLIRDLRSPDQQD